MKNLINKVSTAVPLSFLLALLLMVSISSCSKPNLADIVREHVAAVNNDDIEKTDIFTDEQCVRTGPTRSCPAKPRFGN